MDAKALEAYVSDWSEQQSNALNEARLIGSVVQTLLGGGGTEIDTAIEVEATLLAEIRQIDERMIALAENLELTEAQVAARSKALKAKRDSLQAQLQESAPAGPAPTFGDLYAMDQRYERDELTPDVVVRFQDMLKAFVRHIVVSTKSASPKAFKPETVEIVARAA